MIVGSHIYTNLAKKNNKRNMAAVNMSKGEPAICVNSM